MHAGNASTIGSLLLDTAYLTTGANQANAAAHNISAAMLAAKLSPGALNEAFTQTILQVSEFSYCSIPWLTLPRCIMSNKVTSMRAHFTFSLRLNETEASFAG